VIGRQLRELLVDQRAVLGRRDEERALARDQLLDAVDRVLKQRSIADQREELLRRGAARERPQARARPTRQDQRV